MNAPLMTVIELLPEPQVKPRQLFILLHDAAGGPADMEALAQAIRQAFPAAAVLIPAAPQPSEGASATRNWFLTEGLSEDRRIARVAEAMPQLLAYIQARQHDLGLLPPDTALVGFGQGATMALEAVQAHDGLAGRVLAFSGRYAQAPKAPPQYSTIHLLHGEDDAIVPVAQAKAGYARLAELQGDATIDIASTVGHELHPALVRVALQRLQSHVPKRAWEEAMRQAQAQQDSPATH